MADITLMSTGDILFLYTDGVYDGSGHEERQLLMREQSHRPAKEICNAFLEYAVRKDDQLRRTGGQDRIDDKTVFIIKRS
jgi:serine phosphatase RsbU (regulator of sigma subunit)